MQAASMAVECERLEEEVREMYEVGSSSLKVFVD